MIIDIIDTEYFKNTKLKQIFRIIMLVFYPCLLLFFIIDWLVFPLDAYHNHRDILIVIFSLVLFLDMLFDTTLFTRIGEVEVQDHILIIKHDEIIDRIDLTTINQVKLKRVNYKFYNLIIAKHNIVIELNEYTKVKIKSIFKNFDIKLS
ncbi:hypothetical protein U8527_08520 [Kordia algicida OT-1]|uniref:Uncharacterized protein n=1 Tax=Kordia algicida OT-1 TaxID=391587 RepID=A9E6N4_9FLAO|nr:hypothetical protein [Kordia algicida]EDP95060.1 hypothetical protein KAOT1_01954 [Kordia algicida OT-1]